MTCSPFNHPRTCSCDPNDPLRTSNGPSLFSSAWMYNLFSVGAINFTWPSCRFSGILRRVSIDHQTLLSIAGGLIIISLEHTLEAHNSGQSYSGLILKMPLDIFTKTPLLKSWLSSAPFFREGGRYQIMCVRQRSISRSVWVLINVVRILRFKQVVRRLADQMHHLTRPMGYDQ